MDFNSVGMSGSINGCQKACCGKRKVLVGLGVGREVGKLRGLLKVHCAKGK